MFCKWCEVSFNGRKNAVFCSRSCSISSRNSVEEPDFFNDQSISNEFKGYFAGLFWADGCYSNSNGNDRITLSMNDEQLMQDIHKIISPNRKLYIQKAKKDTHANGYSAINRNPNTISKFVKWGVTYQKSKTIGWPHNFEHDERDFLRGYFDGDGCIYNSTSCKRYKAISFTTGSEKFAKGLRDFLDKNDISNTINYDKRHDAMYIKVYKQKDIKLLYDLMYTNKTWFLNRKKIKFDDIV